MKGHKHAARAMQHSGIFVLVGVLLICAAAFFLCQNMVTERIISTEVENMMELASHDEQTIELMLDNGIMDLTNIGKYLDQMETDTIVRLQDTLMNCKDLISYQRLALVTLEGEVLYSNRVLTKAPGLLETCIKEGESFSRHYYNPNSITDGIGEYLVSGIRLADPVVSEGYEFHYLVSFQTISVLENRVKINSYNGECVTAVVNGAGSYIITSARSSTPHDGDNFYVQMGKVQLLGNGSVDMLREKIRMRENFQVEFLAEDGERTLMVGLPMEINDWQFLMRIPRRIYEEKTRALTSIFLILLLIATMLIFIIVYILLRRRDHFLQIEKDHRAELQKALDKTEQASRAKTVFLSNISHDIRTPMNAIMGFTTLAQQHLDDQDLLSDYLKKIQLSSRHLLGLINDVLDMSRIESGKMTIHPEKDNLADILHGVLDILLADVRSKKLNVTFNVTAIEHENIVCDRLRLNQVLINVLSNAVKFTRDGGSISFTVGEQGMEDQRATYVFTITDTGIGMSPEFLQKVFEPFARESSTTISKIPGTGLGLSITKNIVDMLGGGIQVTSEQGVGTTFGITLSFPVCEDEQKEILPMENILMIGRNEDNQRKLSGMLSAMGIPAQECSTDQEAAERMSLLHFDTVILDWEDETGENTVRTIREKDKDIPILAIIAYNHQKTAEELKHIGIGCLVRPVFRTDLQHKLETIAHTDEEKRHDKEHDFSGMHVLLTEDNALNLEIGKEILLGAGFQVTTAQNGLEAVNMIGSSPAGTYDMVLMDIQMPVMDGYEATRTIRAFEDQEKANIPIIATTANAFEEDQKAALDAGMNAHLSKPIDVRLLWDVMQRIQEGRYTDGD